MCYHAFEYAHPKHVPIVNTHILVVGFNHLHGETQISKKGCVSPQYQRSFKGCFFQNHQKQINEIDSHDWVLNVIAVVNTAQYNFFVNMIKNTNVFYPKSTFIRHSELASYPTGPWLVTVALACDMDQAHVFGPGQDPCSSLWAGPLHGPIHDSP